MSPKVSFIVPCYNLAHLLSECVASVLCQSFTDFEVLIMDDCSPDNTPEVARSFADSRVIYVRNKQNLRHLANYNKGIRLSHGEYIWLISADDRLRSIHALQQYVTLMDEHPEVGFAFSSAMGLRNGVETDLVKWAYNGPHDTVFKGHEFLERLLHGNCVTSPSGMVRRVCYGNGGFPLDLPYAGDWYLWCLFSLQRDVAYFSEPMVNYREHDSSMTNFLKSHDCRIMVNDELMVLWRIHGMLRERGLSRLIKTCEKELVLRYAGEVIKEEREENGYALSLTCLVNGLPGDNGGQGRTGNFCARILTSLGDYHSNGNSSLAVKYYEAAMRHHPVIFQIYAKYLLERFWRHGRRLRDIGFGVNKVFKGVMRRAGCSAFKNADALCTVKTEIKAPD